MTSVSATSPLFVDGTEALILGMTAKTFATRPSLLLGVGDPVVAYALDESIAMRLIYEERRAQDGARSKPGLLPPGQRYETPDEALSGLVN